MFGVEPPRNLVAQAQHPGCDDAQAVVSLAVVSETLSEERLTRIVEKDIVPLLVSIDGVADVQLSGSRQRVLRVALDPMRLTSYGLSVSDVATALRQAPFDVPAGSFRSAEQQLIVRADATAVDATEVADIINSVLLQPLPFEGSEDLVRVFNSYPNAGAPRASNSGSGSV